jgi:hypothetical protein
MHQQGQDGQDAPKQEWCIAIVPKRHCETYLIWRYSPQKACETYLIWRSQGFQCGFSDLPPNRDWLLYNNTYNTKYSRLEPVLVNPGPAV